MNPLLILGLVALLDPSPVSYTHLMYNGTKILKSTGEEVVIIRYELQKKQEV